MASHTVFFNIVCSFGLENDLICCFFNFIADFLHIFAEAGNGVAGGRGQGGGGGEQDENLAHLCISDKAGARVAGSAAHNATQTWRFRLP